MSDLYSKFTATHDTVLASGPKWDEKKEMPKLTIPRFEDAPVSVKFTEYAGVIAGEVIGRGKFLGYRSTQGVEVVAVKVDGSDSILAPEILPKTQAVEGHLDSFARRLDLRQFQLVLQG